LPRVVDSMTDEISIFSIGAGMLELVLLVVNRISGERERERGLRELKQCIV
jgi:hypothetical protein